MNDSKNGKTTNIKKKSSSTDNSLDDTLFRDAMNDVRPIKQDKVTPERDKPSPIPRKTIEDEQQVLTDMVSDMYEPIESHASDQLLFVRSGIQNSVMRKLKRGQYSLSAELDMHGMTINIARQEVTQFLNQCRHDNLRCVRIIHGKGRRSDGKGPVLKNRIDHWLPQRDDVLAYCSAIPAHGGTGAVYVLLKLKR
ncbi:hypothetical protein MNBD_GAMMA12-3473 [hydrothermal vent metagenome]|uniref:Smr domain-containing protein n=1 Tax=hydrothermal vent metagenome TaxID=652676 RepID=A0A3B0YJV0_9ZZZZ